MYKHTLTRCGAAHVTTGSVDKGAHILEYMLLKSRSSVRCRSLSTFLYPITNRRLCQAILSSSATGGSLEGRPSGWLIANLILTHIGTPASGLSFHCWERRTHVCGSEWEREEWERGERSFTYMDKPSVRVLWAYQIFLAPRRKGYVHSRSELPLIGWHIRIKIKIN